MNSQQKQEKEVKLFSLEEIFKGCLSTQKPRNYEEDSLHELLCSRYALSRHTKAERLIELVKKELSL